jgi:hypothetical protein
MCCVCVRVLTGRPLPGPTTALAGGGPLFTGKWLPKVKQKRKKTNKNKHQKATKTSNNRQKKN